jgi:ribosomal protein S19
MGHLYDLKLNVIKKSRPQYYSAGVWRLMHLISGNAVHHTREKRLYTRATTVPSVFVGYEIVVHSGKRWHRRRVNQWMVGFKAGEFTWNRKYALFKAKQLRKKKNKNKK